jgi:hypothetical protein
MHAGGTHQSSFLLYDETLKPAEAEAAAVALDTILLRLTRCVPGTLGVGHPTACEALSVEATGTGAQVLRGTGIRRTGLRYERTVRSARPPIGR